ncbi:MAG TPA: Ig-like domain-containing protein [Candidatus Hydrogenedentes bacterium]|nr:Ig-like domain-containing protein [Candidatus Hydrogenedentota bacterium]HRT21717.1 Ig-like domain-containing protein [Candidatus Hydrogenedentota bacterium]HRT66783.1 Ig-like domain-containing protein [Candidatus Hydrogenedentota bacterium]
MGNRRVKAGLLVLALAISGAFSSDAIQLTQAHDPLLLNVGFSGWSYDTGWMGAGSSVAAYIRLWAGVGGTVLNFSASGAGKFLHPVAVDTGSLWFEGTTGSASQDIGIEFHGQYKIVVFGQEFIGNLPYVPNTDIRLSDSESFTPYLPAENIVLTDTIQNVPLYVYPVGVAGVFSANIGVSVTAGDRIEIDPKTLNTDKGTFTVDGQQIDVSAPYSTVTVSDIHEMIGINPTMTIRPNAVVGITVGPFTYNIDIPTYTFSVPLAGLLQPEYPTTPSRSLTFNLPPVIQSFSINNDAPLTMGRMVNLISSVSNGPLQWMASENPDFTDAVWQPYTWQASFMLQPVDGDRTVYFRVRNANGVSETASDSIRMDRTPPTVVPLITSDTTPPLNGTVLFSTATVSVSVGGQVRSAVNDGLGNWTLADNSLAPVAQGIHEVTVTVTDAIGNSLVDATVNELTIDTTPPGVTVNYLRTNNHTPRLTGTVSDNMGILSVAVSVGGHTYPATIVAGAWTADVADFLPDGIYTVQALATDIAYNTTQGTNELRIDSSAIGVTVDALVTNDTTPPLSGTVDDPEATVTVTVASATYPAANHGNGTWSVPDNTITPLADGTYNVAAAASNPYGQSGADGTTNELRIDSTPPTVTVSALLTNDTTPRLAGTVVDASPTSVEVVVAGQNLTATINGTAWTADVLVPLADGTYNVLATATDELGNTGADTSNKELKIDTVAPEVTVDALTTNDQTPPLSGTVNDSGATIWVTVGTQTFKATNLYGENRWILADNTLATQSEGSHEVEVTAIDPAGNAGYDATHYELLIDTVAPTAEISVIPASPTGLDAIQFRVVFSEPVAPTFTQPSAAGSLAAGASVDIGGADPEYVVTVFPQNPDADGTIGIVIASGAVRDPAGNYYAGGASSLCAVQNWCGFTTQPQNRRLYFGDSCTFTALAGCGTGANLSYQWKWDNGAKAVQDGPATSSWTLFPVTPGHRGEYWCVARYDTEDYATERATLDVRDHLVITMQPQGATMDAGGSYTFSVTTEGGYAPLRYVWKRNGIPVPGGTGASLELTPLGAEHSGVYSVEVSDDHLDVQVSSSATLQVNLPVPGPARPWIISAALACVMAGVWALRRGRGLRRPRA